MLLEIKMMKNKVATLVVIASMSSPTVASSDMLEGALYAIGVTGAISYIVNKNGQTQLQEQQQREFSMRNRSDYPNFICYSDPIDCAYQQGLYDQQKELWENEKTNAYNCGRWGKDCK